MAGGATGAVKQSASAINGRRTVHADRARGDRRSQEPHEVRKANRVACDGLRLCEFEIGVVVGRGDRLADFRVRYAGLASLIREQLVRDTLLHVIGFAGKDHQGLVLRLPAEARHCAVVTVPVLMAGDPEWLRDAYIREDGGVIKRFDQARSEGWSRDAENDLGQVSSEIRLADRAAGGRAAESHDGEEIMYAAV